MPDVVLSAESLGKRYVLHQGGFGYSSLREQLTLNFRAVFSRLRRLTAPQARTAEPATRKASPDDFWALREICLSIRQGDVLGIIGRNGAGKSTLLKIISRITEPTEGVLTIRGRVASLLEVGTGFHPELTGRENIFLNGAVLGMPRSEIRRKFDQIVEFADIGNFLDTPVKRYSSGMYVRLAFSVAAHLEPDILIVDEVLAVGDQVFQRKCIERMSIVAKQGRTVLFVSHNLGLIRLLCKRGVVLKDARVSFDGSVDEAITHYLETIEEQTVSPSLLSQRDRREGSGESILTRIELTTPGNIAIPTMEHGQPARLAFHASRYVPGLCCQFTIYDVFGQAVASFDSSRQEWADDTGSNETAFICELNAITLIPGRYRINAGLYCYGDQLDHLDAAFTFEVAHGATLVSGFTNPAEGSVVLGHRWIRPH
jgi:lipopolysaccharide transport system ATP-binding protein